MKHYSRREFLRRLAAGTGGLAGSLFLEACAREGILTPTPISSNTGASPANTTPNSNGNAALSNTLGSSNMSTLAPISTPTQAAKIPDLVVVRGGEPEQLVERALAALGGIERFVKSGSNVIIKPNMCVSYHTYEYAATTNPWVIGALVRLCVGAGAKQVSVMDFGFGGTQEEGYEVSGIKKEVEAAGGQVATMPAFKYKTVQVNGVKLKETDIFEDILKADVLINVPVAKTHGLAGLTLAMKNLMGVIKNREAVHFNLYQNLADLSTVIHPTLNIIDAVRILTANGPTGGNLDDVKKLDTLIASTDIVAVDSYGATLFGLTSKYLPNLGMAAKMGLGIEDLSQLNVEELSIN